MREFATVLSCFFQQQDCHNFPSEKAIIHKEYRLCTVLSKGGREMTATNAENLGNGTLAK